MTSVLNRNYSKREHSLQNIVKINFIPGRSVVRGVTWFKRELRNFHASIINILFFIFYFGISQRYTDFVAVLFKI